MSNERPIGQMRVYGCGGAGTNIVANYLELAGTTPVPGFAVLNPVFIDTSKSNMREGIDANNSYIMPDLDGSGKIRAENYDAINNVVKEILLKYKPLDFNVVVFSASGGTGGVAATLILNELLQRGEIAVALVVGSDESAKATENSINTLKSLDGVSAKTGRPIVTFYRHNIRGRSRVETDNDMILGLSALAILASRQVQEVDTADVFNFVNYDRVTTAKPTLAGLEIFNDAAIEDLKKLRTVSMVSIYQSPDTATVDVTPEYHAAGYAEINVGGSHNVHYAVDPTLPNKWFASLKATLSTIDEARTARPQTERILSQNDEANDKGIVL